MTAPRPEWVEVENKPDHEAEAALEYLARLSRKADECWCYVTEAKP